MLIGLFLCLIGNSLLAMSITSASFNKQFTTTYNETENKKLFDTIPVPVQDKISVKWEVAHKQAPLSKAEKKAIKKQTTANYKEHRKKFKKFKGIVDPEPYMYYKDKIIYSTYKKELYDIVKKWGFIIEHQGQLTELTINTKKDFLLVEKVFSYKNQIIVFYVGKHLYYQIINLDTVEISERTPIHDKRTGLLNEYSIHKRDNLIWITYPTEVAKKEFLYNVKLGVFDLAKNMEKNQEVNIPMMNKGVPVLEDIHVENQKTYLLYSYADSFFRDIGNVFRRKTKKFESNSAAFVDIYSINSIGEVIGKETSLDGSYPHIQFSFNVADKILIIGGGSEVAVETLNKSDLATINIDKEELGVIAHLAGMEELIINEDNSISVVIHDGSTHSYDKTDRSESTSKRTVYSGTGDYEETTTTTTTTTTTIESTEGGNIYITNISPDGAINWSNTIEKSQTSESVNDPHCAYFYAEVGPNLFFFYNSWTGDKSTSEIYATKLALDGTATTTILTDGTERILLRLGNNSYNYTNQVFNLNGDLLDSRKAKLSFPLQEFKNLLQN